MGELKSQTTSQIIDLQNDFLGVEKRRWVLSNNANIPVIQSKQASAGISYNRRGLLISLEGFYKEVEGITTRSQGFQNQYQFVNAVGEYKVSGFDFLINKQWTDLSTWLSYSFSKNDYVFENLNFEDPFPNNFDIRHNLSFATTYNWKSFKFAVGVNWRTGKPFTQPNPDNPVTNNFINYDDPNAENISDYLRVDLSSTYEFKIREMDAEIGFSLWNVLDRINTINTYFVLDDTDTISKIDNESLGITPNLSFRIKI